MSALSIGVVASGCAEDSAAVSDALPGSDATSMDVIETDDAVALDVLGRLTEPSDVDGDEDVNAGQELDATSEVMGDALTSDGESDHGDAGPPLLASCTVEMTVGEETQTLLDATYEGFKENEFGATIYGHMLKVWVGEGLTTLEILIRTDQTTIPGVVIPSGAGSHAWLLVMIENSKVYTTQTAGGIVTITTCPSEEGTLVSGTISNVTVYEMGTFQPATLNGSFEVVLGRVDGEAVCSGL
jgi:hypothetical protein